MFSFYKVVVPAVGIALVFGAAGIANAEVVLAGPGHFIGYGVVTAITGTAGTGTDCPDASTDQIMTQLELNTVKGFPVFKIRHAVDGATAPSLYEYDFDRTGGPKDSQSGKVFLHVEGTSTTTKGNYTLAITPYDPNSFAASLAVTFPNCTESVNLAFVRSSAD